MTLKFTVHRNTGVFPLLSKGLEPATSCAKDQDATTAPARRNMWETESLNWALFMLQWFIRFTEFNEISAPFRKTILSRDQAKIASVSIAIPTFYRKCCFSCYDIFRRVRILLQYYMEENFESINMCSYQYFTTITFYVSYFYPYLFIYISLDFLLWFNEGSSYNKSRYISWKTKIQQD